MRYGSRGNEPWLLTVAHFGARSKTAQHQNAPARAQIRLQDVAVQDTRWRFVLVDLRPTTQARIQRLQTDVVYPHFADILIA